MRHGGSEIARPANRDERLDHRGIGSEGIYNAFYIGSQDGPERRIIEQYNEQGVVHGSGQGCADGRIQFYSISCGKLRRYFSWKNFLMPFQTLIGLFQAFRILRRVRPDAVFSKGGYVSVPVVIAARMLKIPVILHESDVSPGLANRICAWFARIVCVSWSETMRYFSRGSDTFGRVPASDISSRVLVTGIPVRENMLHGERERGLKLTGFDGKKPVLLVMGGSLGAESLNRIIVEMLPKLLRVYDVVHLIGVGKNIAHHSSVSGGGCYKSFEYLDSDLAHVYAISDVIVSRAGAGSIAEISALQKCAVYIPLGLSSSRGDQILNARKMEEIGGGMMIGESDINSESHLNGKSHQESRLKKILFDLAGNEEKRTLMGKRAYEFGSKCVKAADIIADLIASCVRTKVQ